jgi:Reverse transcriptase (RNA-dependent DNA polymerase)
MIPTQKEPSANEPRATNELRAMNSNGDAERIDPEQDL